MSKQVYLFSGLGADRRIFQRLHLDSCNMTFIEWIPPLEEESIGHYASRLLIQIIQPRPILIGLSFGGIMAIEVAKLIDTEKVILISSVKSADEIPFYYRWMGQAGIHNRIPPHMLRKTNFITRWLFGTVSMEDKELLKQILGDTDPVFFRWALEQVVQWKNSSAPGNTVHIHGTGDKIFPVWFTGSDILIKNGGHFMTLNKAEEISEILNDQISGS